MNVRNWGQICVLNIIYSSLSCLKAMGADGVPLCVFCSSPVEAAGFSNDNAAWDTRYCSEICKEENKVRCF